MTPLSLALYLTYLYFGDLAQTTDLKSSIYVRQESGVIPANVGDNVTLRCFYEGHAVMFFWYKQSLGEKPKPMTVFYRHQTSGNFLNEFKNNDRLRLVTGAGENHLTIRNLVISDSATYYCTGSFENDFEFVEGTTVSVKGSDLRIPAIVHQSESENIQPGGSGALSCSINTGTCDGEHSVYWFKTSEGSHPGLFYTHGGRNDQRESNTQLHSCFYNLPVEKQNFSHDGTYCAVATCGHILFGNKTQLDSANGIVLEDFLIGALAFSMTLVIILGYATYTTYRSNRSHCTDSRTSNGLTSNAVDFQDTDGIHYSVLRVQKVNNRPTRHECDTLSECVYSSVRQ
ncbi:immunoglobulin kappa light chain [Labrus bergylta]|uniref:immunoglobulin kappa light chain n=1 Tax=Labrus bergylta TaxID=56723 RepID=UPI0033141702